MSEQIDISGMDKADVLCKLHHASFQQGMGALQKDIPLTHEDAGELLKQTTYFDYLRGRIMKVSLKGDTLDPWLYDRDNGEGAAARALAEPNQE